jgi:hypothetical protein
MSFVDAMPDRGTARAGWHVRFGRFALPGLGLAVGLWSWGEIAPRDTHVASAPAAIPATWEVALAGSEKSSQVHPASGHVFLPSPAASKFDRISAEKRARLIAAFKRARDNEALSKPVDRFETPIAQRFGPAAVTPATVQDNSLAVALATPMDVQLDFGDGENQVAALEPQDGVAIASPSAIPDTVAVPPNRPRTVTDATDNVVIDKPARAPAVSQPDASSKKPGLSRTARSSDNVLAYAKPDDDGEGGVGSVFGNLFKSGSAATAKGSTAVYDISAGMVYMPDGRRLEAHSGLGAYYDNPTFVSKKDVGPTPPNTYKLSMRESRFHGVEAIRLTPTTGQSMYGRDGFLAHTYMLRGRYAQSNGCVSFKNYEQFLRAFKDGKVTHLVVVPGQKKGRTRIASNGNGA